MQFKVSVDKNFKMTTRMNISLNRIPFYLMVLWGAAIFWIAPHPPMIDLPQHGGQVALLKDLIQGTSSWTDLFQINLFTPYLTGYGASLLLSFLMPVVTALKMMLSVSFVAFIYMGVKLRRHVQAPSQIDWLFLPSFFGFCYMWGFYTFLVAAPVCLWFFYRAFIYAERASIRSGLLVFVSGTVLLASHGLAFVLGWTVGMGLLLVRGAKIRNNLVAALPFAALALMCIGFYLLGRHIDVTINKGPAEMAFGGGPLFRFREALFFPFSSNSQMSSAKIFVPAAIAFIASPFLMGLSVNRTNKLCWVPFFTVVLIFLFAPSIANNTAFVYERFSLFLLPTYALIFTNSRSALPPTRSQLQLTCSSHFIVAVCCFALFGFTSLKTWRFAEETAAFDAALDRIAPGQRALALIFDASSTGADNSGLYVHYTSWYQAQHHGLTDFNFAWYFPQIVRYRTTTLPTVGVGFQWTPMRFDWVKHGGEKYRYFFVKAKQPLPDNFFHGAECEPIPILHQDDWTIYEKCTASIDQIDAYLLDGARSRN